MRYAGVGLKSFLASRQPFFQADLFTITLSTGAIYRWTTMDQPISAGPWTWVAVGPIIERTGWQVKNTMSIPSMTMKLYSTGADFGGLNIKQAIHNGLLDRATVLLQRAIMPTYGDTSLGLVDIYRGNVSTVTLNAIGAEITVKGANVALQANMPRNLYQLGCIHTLYDVGCTLLRTAYQETHTVSGGDRVTIAFSDAAIDPTKFYNGTILFTSGAASGTKRTLYSAISTQVACSYPLLQTPQPGDTFVLTQGCSRTTDRCASFGNSQNFRGFPFIPPVETAV